MVSFTVKCSVTDLEVEVLLSEERLRAPHPEPHSLDQLDGEGGAHRPHVVRHEAHHLLGISIAKEFSIGQTGRHRKMRKGGLRVPGYRKEWI